LAKLKNRRPSNVDGPFYVASSCIDCDACRWIAPEIFDERDGASRVHRQPVSDDDWLDAEKALIACPTGSIISQVKTKAAAGNFFPEVIEGDVYYCGYHAAASYGAASYLIRRPQGNVLIDSPRFARALVNKIEALGGVDLMFLTHRDDVADHAQFARHFGCTRMIHADDVDSGLSAVEQKLSGATAVRIDADLTAIPVPGHTKGSVCLLYKDRFLFTGDHLSWDGELDRLRASRQTCWYDWRLQTQSMGGLRDYRFQWILPGHGRRLLPDGGTDSALQELVGRMAGTSEMAVP